MTSDANIRTGVIVAQKARKLRVAGARGPEANFASLPLHVLRERAGVRVLSANQTVFAGKMFPTLSLPGRTGGGDQGASERRPVIGQCWHEI